MDVKTYDAMRNQYDIIRNGDKMAEESQSNVVQFQQVK